MNPAPSSYSKHYICLLKNRKNDRIIKDLKKLNEMKVRDESRTF